MRILVIEDERQLALYLRKGLEEHSFAVDVALNGEEGVIAARENAYDAIILDLLLPKKSGMAVLRELRATGNDTPLLILTARHTLGEKLEGFNSGADDYLTKPFAFLELLARLRALLRRGKEDVPLTLQVDDLSLDLVAHRVCRAGKELQLTNKEFCLLEFFLRNPGRVLTRTVISEHVWDARYDDILSNVVDVFVNRLRNKIDRAGQYKLLHTVKGVGYVLRPEDRV